MADRPIIFSGPMVRALLAGRKTQTRRLTTSRLRRCEQGDRLHVRESGIFFPGRPGGAGKLFRHDVPATPEHGIYWSRNNGGPGAGYSVARCSRSAALTDGRAKIRPSIHMPRWASRLTLIVDAVRIDLLQSISEADAIAEGMAEYPCTGPHRGEGATFWSAEPGHPEHGARTTPVAAYQALWETLHGAESWNANPDVLALTFRVERGNIDQIARDG